MDNLLETIKELADKTSTISTIDDPHKINNKINEFEEVYKTSKYRFLDPETKIKIIKLCENSDVNTIANSLNISIQIIQSWIEDFSRNGEKIIYKKHQNMIRHMSRLEKVEILEEAGEEVNKTAQKYGIKATTLKDWEKKIKLLGREKFISKQQGFNGGMKCYKKEEKLQILDELANNGLIPTCEKYDIDRESLEAWKGRLNFFGEEGLDLISDRAKRNRLDYPHEAKKEALEYYKRYGLRETRLKFGVRKKALQNWHRQLNMESGELETIAPINMGISKEEKAKRRKEKYWHKKKGIAYTGSKIDLFPPIREDMMFIDSKCIIGEVERVANEQGVGIKRVSMDVNTPSSREEDDLKGNLNELKEGSCMLGELGSIRSSHDICDPDNQTTPFDPMQEITNNVQNYNSLDENMGEYDGYMIGNLVYQKYFGRIKDAMKDLVEILPPVVYKKLQTEMDSLFNKYVKPSFSFVQNLVYPTE